MPHNPDPSHAWLQQMRPDQRVTLFRLFLRAAELGSRAEEEIEKGPDGPRSVPIAERGGETVGTSEGRGHVTRQQL